VLVITLNQSFAQKRELAITIDDLPFVGESQNKHLNMILHALQENNTPATGFIIAGEVTPRNWPMLRKCHEAGMGLGNHTLSHINLKTSTASTYIQEIEDADKILAPLLTKPKYFRYPYLAMGSGQKKEQVEHYLSKKQYHVAPISIDSKDFVFNQLLLSVPEAKRRHFLTVLEPCYLEFIWQQTLKAEERNRLAHKEDQPNILLIHANLLNAYVLPDMIRLYQEHGFHLITLEEALNPGHAIPSLPTDDSNSDGITYL
jgi:peptidoglycan/xylan/chitin deacetylase (PgdA/CDA1 family)